MLRGVTNLTRFVFLLKLKKREKNDLTDGK
jgi:hypothetical protein